MAIMRGRPGRTAPERVTKRGVNLTAQQWRAVRLLAVDQNVTASEVVRRALDEHLARHAGGKEPKRQG